MLDMKVYECGCRRPASSGLEHRDQKFGSRVGANNNNISKMARKTTSFNKLGTCQSCDNAMLTYRRKK
jgi:hypothetical protein